MSRQSSAKVAPSWGDRITGWIFIVCGMGCVPILVIAAGRGEPLPVMAVFGGLGAVMLLIGLTLVSHRPERYLRTLIVVSVPVAVGFGLALVLFPDQMTTSGVRGPQTPTEAFVLGVIVLSLILLLACFGLVGWVVRRRGRRVRSNTAGESG